VWGASRAEPSSSALLKASLYTCSEAPPSQGGAAAAPAAGAGAPPLLLLLPALGAEVKRCSCSRGPTPSTHMAHTLSATPTAPSTTLPMPSRGSRTKAAGSTSLCTTPPMIKSCMKMSSTVLEKAASTS
jgi:hypothetical protein